jgi:DNA-binding NtrC family response regulator
MILCVADREELLLRVADVLRNVGSQAFLCLTIADAIRVLRYQRVELVMVDDLLAANGGCELVREARKVSPAIPVVLWTAAERYSEVSGEFAPDVVVMQANGIDELLSVVTILRGF